MTLNKPQRLTQQQLNRWYAGSRDTLLCSLRGALMGLYESYAFATNTEVLEACRKSIGYYNEMITLNGQA